ncbi:class I SAM-dependent methyltransferase [Paludibacterium yongneupense]|uniref:class I SAM-dependent methyltransferase n=1 Tax=Paludibacterium yongneupense TaxID=400061 RepID=UPI00040C1785|nr:class I SAM-dependent methyltransferase [Paludibacterium yongneupense]
MKTHHDAVHAQFDPRAQAYLTSRSHAEGADLLRAQALVAQTFPARANVLDIGCGAGHLSYALAPGVARVVALDPSERMLAVVAAEARARSLPQIETRAGRAEALSFDDASFCMAASRYSAHHWTQLETALHEMRRVIRPGGYLMMIDIEGCEDALVDTHLQTIELLRDRSHVKNRSPSEWRRLLHVAGFDVLAHESWPTRLDFTAWVERMRTPPDLVAVLHALQSGAPQEVRQALAIEDDGSFTVNTGLFWARVSA